MIRFPTGRSIAVAVTLCALLQACAKAQTSPRVATPESQASGGPYRELHRPQFHYTVKKGWINDPIGLVFYQGEYHLFNDHNPFSCRFPGGKTDGEQSHWSHAISTDLVHWKHLPIAVHPDVNGACWSGSGVVDWKNTAGFQKGKEPPLVLVYTSAGKTFGQSLVYSNDCGRTWNKYEGNPVLKQIAPNNRDPQVFWHEATKKWVMVLYVRKGIANFFTSNDLKKWTPTSEVRLAGFRECPDLFELPLDGDKTKTKWILYDAPFNYSVGTFDGEKFTPEAGPFRGDLGRNFYAAQSWHNTKDRRIQIAWMRGGKYPGMPFNQQMSFPCELTLRTFPEGIRLCREPVKEIGVLRTKQHAFTNKLLKPSENLLRDMQGELFEIKAEIELDGATSFGLRARGEAIDYDVAAKTVKALGAKGPLEPINNRIKLHVLVDRATLEVFGNDGKLSMSSCFLQDPDNKSLEIYTVGGNIKVISLVVYELKSSWPEPVLEEEQRPAREIGE